jgi:hypothetical protein
MGEWGCREIGKHSFLPWPEPMFGGDDAYRQTGFNRNVEAHHATGRRTVHARLSEPPITNVIRGSETQRSGGENGDLERTSGFNADYQGLRARICTEAGMATDVTPYHATATMSEPEPVSRGRNGRKHSAGEGADRHCRSIWRRTVHIVVAKDTRATFHALGRKNGPFSYVTGHSGSRAVPGRRGSGRSGQRV